MWHIRAATCVGSPADQRRPIWSPQLVQRGRWADIWLTASLYLDDNRGTLFGVKDRLRPLIWERSGARSITSARTHAATCSRPFQKAARRHTIAVKGEPLGRP